MKNSLFTVVLIFSFLIAAAQKPEAGRQKGINGNIYGKVVNNIGEPISSVSVTVLQDKYDSGTGKTKVLLLKGTVTNANGEFGLNGLPTLGELKLNISAIGYRPYKQEFSFFSTKQDSGSVKPDSKASEKNDPSNGLAHNRDLGNIELHADFNQLQTVVVTASKPLIQMHVNKKVFNVDKNIVSAGGTAVDVMYNSPRKSDSKLS